VARHDRREARNYGSDKITDFPNSRTCPCNRDSVVAAPTRFVLRLDTHLPRTQPYHFSSYLGGSGPRHELCGADFKVIATGGETSSAKIFPKLNPFSSNLQGLSDAFVTKLIPVINWAGHYGIGTPKSGGSWNAVTFKYTVTNNSTDPTSGVAFS